MPSSKDIKLAIIGLGYVGLPLAIEFGKIRPVIGFDVDEIRIKDLTSGVDHTLEIDPETLKSARDVIFTSDLDFLSGCNVFIVTVPTPVDDNNEPDLSPILNASKTIGSILKSGDVVIYESTVYPGCTEEQCVPVLEHESGLAFNIDFFVGYSPERINPGDKERRLATIKKITSGSNEETAKFVDSLYREVIVAGTFRAASIRIAEAAKVIENTQRDLNIALINEFAIIFNKIGIDTEEVLDAASSKWNFLPFRPGLVGGHCIGVDPYYLIFKARTLNYNPEIIMAGRRLNDMMGEYVVSQLVNAMYRREIKVEGARVLVLGLAFKENCPDIRNTRVIDIVEELKKYHAHVDLFDPWVNVDHAEREYGVSMINAIPDGSYDAIVIAVAHSHFRELGAAGIRKFGRQKHLIYDLKCVLGKEESDLRL